MDISSLNVAQSCWCGNEGKIFSFLCKKFVDFTHFRRLHLLCQSQFSTSEEDAGIHVLSSCRQTDKQFYLAAIPWTLTYRSLPPPISVPAFMQASKPWNRLPTDPLATSCGCVVVVSRISGVRRGWVQARCYSSVRPSISLTYVSKIASAIVLPFNVQLYHC